MTEPASVKIPADIDRDDRLVANLTARQLAILGVTGVALYGAWVATRQFVPIPVFLGVALPLGVLGVAVTLGQRDGVSLDRLLVAAIRHSLRPRRRVAAPEGIPQPPRWATPNPRSSRARPVHPVPLDSPASGVSRAGVVDLGADGMAMVAACSPVNFALRTPAEQHALIGSFGRWLHSLTAPVQLLVRVERLDLTERITELREQAAALPHTALEQAARSRADFLASLGRDSDLLHRQVLLVLRQPAPGVSAVGGPGTRVAGLFARRLQRSPDHAQASETQLVQRAREAAGLLSTAGISVTLLDQAQATAVLAGACNPDHLIPAGAALAGPDEVITTAPAEVEADAEPVPSQPNPGEDDPRLHEFQRRYAA